MLQIIYILLGIGLLVFGRKLFWLFVGAVGFLAGVNLVTIGWNGPESVAIIVGILAGLVFAALAIFFQSLAIGLTGFLGGGALFIMLAGWVLRVPSPPSSSTSWAASWESSSLPGCLTGL